MQNSSAKVTLKKQFRRFAILLQDLLLECILVAKDPVHLWDVGRALTIAIPSSLYLLPFHVVREHGKLDLLTLRKRLKCISYLFNAVMAVRLAFLASICLDPKFRLNVNGKISADAITFCVGVLFVLAAYLCHFILLYNARDFVFLYNSVRRLNKGFSGILISPVPIRCFKPANMPEFFPQCFAEKHLSTTDLIYCENGKLLRLLCIWCGICCPTAPFTMAVLAAALAQTPFMLPYHVLGNTCKLFSLECVLLSALDWAIFTVGILSFYIVFVVSIDAVIRITLICKVLRFAEKPHLRCRVFQRNDCKFQLFQESGTSSIELA